MPSGQRAPLSTSTTSGTGPKHQFQYYGEEGEWTIMQYADGSLAAGLCAQVAEAAGAAIGARGACSVALSGGSALTMLEGLAAHKEVDWSKASFFVVDERVVPASSPDSNLGAAKAGLLAKLGVPDANVHGISDPPLQPAQEALMYEAKLLSQPAEVLPRTDAGLPAFDVVVLGIGEDGHVASLFPNRPETAATAGIALPVTTSPKPPANRVTLTLPVINSAAKVIIAASGAGKAEIVQRVVEHQTLPGALPAQLVRPAVFCIDASAADMLSPTKWLEPKLWPRSEVPKPAKK
mmetsp:Transcript_2035/g.7444  ORF Transcript_2035/g.7444 Transcript_2035/m.7444 type:complete len:293 (+) Transcript_2035:107-985(+)